ncbi:MAG: hypothetical protein KAT65_00235, partial [Methanophagales archaeon]|nr:hypothetical protein [Methanophagales archaeon]
CLNNLSSLYSYLHLQQRGENKEGWKYCEDNVINYPILKMLMDNLVNRNHGVISAVSLMERLIYGIGGIKDVDYISSCISPASLAIALHDNEVYNRTEIDSIYFEDNPFTFLLIYCDALQEEGRPQQVNPIDNISPILVVKELQENNIYFILEYDEDKVTYVDNKGQEHSRFEDKAVECENMRKKLKSKNILFKIGIQLKGKSIEPVEERNYTIPKK